MWSTILAFVGPLLVRILGSLSIGLVAYVGFNELAQRLVGEAVASLSSLPASLVQWAGLLGIDRFVSIVLSALLARFALRALNVIGVKKGMSGITLRTGLPGHGKSLLAIWEIEKLRQSSNRPVYYNGIPDLKLPWIEVTDQEIQEWWKIEDGAIIVIDEAQRHFRPRANGSQVPEKVARFEVHRKSGHDIVLITQHSGLIDANIRKLVDSHIHVFRGWGLGETTRYEWQEIQNERDRRVRKDCTIKKTVRFPKEAYGWYHSANVHNVPRKLPVKLLGFVAGLLCIIGYSLYSFVVSWRADHPGGKPLAAVEATAAAGGALVRDRVMTAEELAKALTPVVPGIPASAPLYQPKWLDVAAVPVIQGCVASADTCACYTQQGTRVDVDERLCRSMVSRPVFDHTRAPAPPAQATSAAAPAGAGVVPGAQPIPASATATHRASERPRVVLPSAS